MRHVFRNNAFPPDYVFTVGEPVVLLGRFTYESDSEVLDQGIDQKIWSSFNKRVLRDVTSFDDLRRKARMRPKGVVTHPSPYGYGPRVAFEDYEWGDELMVDAHRIGPWYPEPSEQEIAKAIESLTGKKARTSWDPGLLPF